MGFLIDLLIDILVSALSRIVTGELSAHVESFARWIISKAANRLPPNGRERFREEWLRHLKDAPGAVGKLRHALGCYLGAPVVCDVLAKQQKRRKQVRSETGGDIDIVASMDDLRKRKLYIQFKYKQEFKGIKESEELLAAIRKVLHKG